MALRKISEPITRLEGTEHLDELTANGTYHQAMVVKSSTDLGYPAEKVAGLLEVHSPDANMVYQRFTEFWSGRVWHRGSYRGEWKPWVEVATR